MRTIKLKLPTQTGLVTVQTPVVTLGDLQKAILEENINVDLTNSKFIARSNNAEYTNNKDAMLPQGDEIFFVTPIHTNKGLDISVETFLRMPKSKALEFVNSLNYNTIRTFGRLINDYENEYIITTSGRFSEMLFQLKEYVEYNFAEEETPHITEVSEVSNLITSAIENLEKALELYRESEYVDGVTLGMLEEEHSRLIALNS